MFDICFTEVLLFKADCLDRTHLGQVTSVSEVKFQWSSDSIMVLFIILSVPKTFLLAKPPFILKLRLFCDAFNTTGLTMEFTFMVVPLVPRPFSLNYFCHTPANVSFSSNCRNYSTIMSIQDDSQPCLSLSFVLWPIRILEFTHTWLIIKHSARWLFWMIQGAICSGSILSASKHLYVWGLFLDSGLCAFPPEQPCLVTGGVSLHVSYSRYSPMIDPMEEPRLPYVLFFLVTHCLLLPEALSYHFLPEGHLPEVLMDAPCFALSSGSDIRNPPLIPFLHCLICRPLVGKSSHLIVCALSKDLTEAYCIQLAILFRPWKYCYPSSHAVLRVLETCLHSKLVLGMTL